MQATIERDTMIVSGHLNDDEIDNIESQGWQFKKAIFESRFVKYLFEWKGRNE